jgi:hypothetical protein
VPVQLDLDPDTFAASVEEKGISADRPVVMYDDGSVGSMFASRYVLLLLSFLVLCVFQQIEIWWRSVEETCWSFVEKIR